MQTADSLTSLKEENALTTYFNEADEDKFNKSLVLDYYKEQGLNPIQMGISSRYICILFEPLLGSQELHILQRYTNAILYQTQLSTNVATFHLYDPIDCQLEDNYAEGDAHLIMTLEKKAEHSSQFLHVLKISKKNIVYSLKHEISEKKFDTFLFSAVSIDMKYFAISRIFQIPKEEIKKEDILKHPCQHYVLFVSLSNKKFKNVSETPKLLKSNQLALYPKIIFVNQSDKALIFIHGVEIQLYDIVKKQNLSTVNLKTYEGLEVGYYLDQKQYFMIDKKQLKEWKISLKADQIKLVETNPIINIDPDVNIEFSVNCIPYHHQLKNMTSVKWFSFNGRFITIQLDRKFIVFDIDKNKEVLSALGMKIIFSDDQQSLIINVGGQYYKYYDWNSDEGLFQLKQPFIKNVVSRVDFVPGSSSKVVIYDEQQNCLILRDFLQNTNTFLMKKLTFSSDKYTLLNNNLISFFETRSSQSGKQNYFIIFNFEQQYPELELQINDQILDVRLSLDQKFLYISNSSQVKVLDIKNLKSVVCKYMIQNVNQIIEQTDQTYLICKNSARTQIFGVKTLNPITKAQLPTKTDSFTSSTFLMKYIIKGLNHEDNLVKENSLVAYQTFHQFGMVDTFYGQNGLTILHHIIKNNDQSLMQKFFDNVKVQNLYHATFKGMSPLSYAYEMNKLQHMNIILEFFCKHQESIIVTSEDLLTLMDCPLPSAKLLILNLFTVPRFYKCALPFNVDSNKQIILVPFQNNLIGQPLCNKIVDLFQNNPGGEDIVLQICSSIFEYDFERGSASSLNFLKKYSKETSEDVVRSNLRFIIAYKYEECLTFLRLQAAAFFLFLASFYIRQIFLYDSLFYTLYLLVFNSIFFGYELNQIFRSGIKNHFDNIWNFTDMIAYTLFYFSCIRNFMEIQNKAHLIISTLIDNVTLICLLLRGMSHLRIFSSLRYFNNMIIEIIRDMASFTIILIYWIVGFSLMFYLFTFERDYDYEESFDIYNSVLIFVNSLQFTYKLSFGDFDTTEFSSQQWILFIISSFFIPLVLFNLIIAVMGDTYDRVQTLATSVDLKEQAKLVMEVEGLLNLKNKTYVSKLHRLLICHNAEIGQDAPEQIKWEGKIKILTKIIQRVEEKVQGSIGIKKDILDAVDEVKIMVKKLRLKLDNENS
ncbi:wd-40 repeat protein [Stylonychia lemnae]|uniref:Wd-40 repeat protein n=1 Tax=Stylonychia lemnae TaxID=5949 RepID=A0A078AJ90_STYLE|nr:wd-40 repeat protein [Stylonychia lemnae]|eukprot:CDW81552.1 wd-40 repeat protein [Stylonychia lemnae]